MKYRFDSIELDTEHLALTAAGVSLPADARSVELLRLLIESWPAHCDRRVLLEKLWPTTVVAHWSLARLVSDTRRLIANAGYRGPLIQTVHGRGYRLAPELARHFGLPGLTSADVESGGAAPRVHRRLPAAMLLFGFVLATGGVLGWWQLMANEKLTIGEADDVIGRVLWVDDHPENNLEERRFLESQRIAVYTAISTEDALKLLAMYEGRFDAVISDMGRNEDALAGLKLVEQMRERHDETPFFMYTILPSDAQRQHVFEAGGQGVSVTSKELYGFILPLFPGTRAAD